MHQHLDQLKDREKLSAWIRRISYTTLMDFYRKSPKNGDAPGDLVAEEAADQEGNHALQQCVLALMSGLAPQDRHLLEKVEIKGVSQAQLARELNLPFSTVKSRLQRAKARIRQQIQSQCLLQLDPYGNVVDYQLPVTGLPASLNEPQ